MMAVSSHLFAMLRSSGECARLVDFDSTVTLLWTPTAVIILNGSLSAYSVGEMESVYVPSNRPARGVAL